MFFFFCANVEQIVDFRFAKQMKGAHSFTICGDPLFFSPELVNHQGYDYAADLWAYGVLCYEMCEEITPFGNADTDETTIFKKISSFKGGDLPFTDKTPAALRPLLQQLLNPVPQLRIGYDLDNAIQESPYFSGKKQPHSKAPFFALTNINLEPVNAGKRDFFLPSILCM